MKITKRRFVIVFFAGLFVLCVIYSFVPLYIRRPVSSAATITLTVEPFIDVNAACQEITLIVQKGDTLDSISMNYAVSKDYIKHYNRMETDEVFTGMTLLIQMCSNMSMPTVTPTK